MEECKSYISVLGILEKGMLQTANYTVKAVSEGMPTYSILQEAKKKGIAYPIVVNQGLMEEEKGLSVGESVLMKIEDEKVEATIVDVVKEIPINFLSVISVLAIIVGGMSMASIIGISISERKREMGIFRAIGASDEKISKMITMEVVIEGLLSWIVGCVLAYPISIVTGNFFGQIFLHSNLQNVLSLNGMMIWFGLSLLVAVTAGLLPGRSICKQSLREMLAYE